MRNSNKAPKFSSMTEYELQNFYSNKKERRKNVRQELSIYIVWFSAAINLGSRWKRGHPYITSFFISQEICLFHYSTFYKWTKISSLKILIFGFKNDGEKWSGIYFEIHGAPSEIPANLPGQFNPNGQIFGTGQKRL